MFWVLKFAKKAATKGETVTDTLKAAIREFTIMNGRMPSSGEMNKMEGIIKNTQSNVIQFPKQKSSLADLLRTGVVKKGVAPKTTPKDPIDQRWVDQEEWKAKKRAENKAAIKGFEEKFGKPEDRASGGLAGQLHLNRQGYSSGLLVKLAKLLKGSGKKTFYRGEPLIKNLEEMKKLEEVYKTIKARNTIMPEKFRGRWFAPNREIAELYANPEPGLSLIKKVKLTPEEIKFGKKLIKKSKTGVAYLGDNVVIPKHKIKDIETDIIATIRSNLKKTFEKKAEGGLAGQLHLNQGGRVPAYKGGLMKLLKALSAKSPGQRYKDYLASVKRRSQEGDFKSLAPELGAVAGSGILVNRAMSKKLKDITNQERDAWYKKLEAEYREEYKDDPDMLRLKLKMLEEDRENFQNRKWWQRGPAYNDGGRVRFDNGGMSRRSFLKLMGGLASIPILGKFFKLAKPAAKVMTAVEKSNAAGMPKWFPSLVNKVLKEGEDIGGTVERQIVKQVELPKSKTKVTVEHDLNTGDTIVDVGRDKHGWSDGWHGQPVRLHLKKGEWMEPDMDLVTGKLKKQKPVKKRDEFDVEEAEFTGDAESVKYEESTFNKFGEHGSDFSEVEKYATGKVTKGSKPKKFIREPDYAKGGLAGVLKL